MCKTFLVATDFSDTAQTALSHGIELARQAKADLHVLHVLETDFATLLPPVDAVPDAERWVRTARTHAEQLMEEFVAEVSTTEVRVTSEVLEAPTAAPAILEQAEAHHVDTLILGTHGRRGLRRLVLGSVAEEVARLAQCSVFTVTPRCSAEAPKPQEILVAVDFSSLADRVLAEARNLAREYDAHVTVLHAVPQPYYPPEYAAVAGEALVQSMPEMLTSAREVLEERVEALGSFPRGCDVEAAAGRAGAAIVERAEFHEADLIVQGSRGLSGVKHLVLGSVADHVVRCAPCPVLTLHPEVRQRAGRKGLKTLLEESVVASPFECAQTGSACSGLCMAAPAGSFSAR